MTDSESIRQDSLSSGTWDDIKELPPSAKLVAKVLEQNEAMTQQMITEETLLPDRTVRYALSRLDEENTISSRFSVMDARRQLYTLDINS
ncbi:helix-turn-helix domain-containing protein [Saliphagus sp. LR7]|uniref:MarR family transcriptional regulator n=1 Tax=Saliphagus sp. LR7 TaxID=2282654 RepID=UPI000DF77256|nr:helix-turn-helix domain-containing protein [Saliphagus sp. LR7]